MRIPVEGHPNLFRDDQTGAIINCDTVGYNQYVSSRDRMNNQKQELKELKSEINEIKKLLKELTNGSN